MTDTGVTIVRFRDPRPPHGAYLTMLPADVKYSFKLRRTGQAIIEVSRKDPNVAMNLDRLLPPEPPMITIERPDQQLPWVGFVTGYRADISRGSVTFEAADHAWRFSAPHGARTRKNANYRAASGTIIRNVFQDMEERGEPAPLLKYDTVTLGPGANYEVRADYGMTVLEELAKQCNAEWGFSYNVSPSRVETHLTWQQRIGIDRRNEEIWSEQKHFTEASYSLNYANGVRATMAVGGSGAFANRPTAVASASGSAGDLARNDIVQRKTPTSAYGLGGTRIFATEQVTDLTVLKTRAAQMQDEPAYAVEQIGLVLFEDALDMTRFGVGDIRTIRLQTTSLGTALERVVRIIGIEVNPDTHQHPVECQVIG